MLASTCTCKHTSSRRHPGSPSHDFLHRNEDKSASLCAGVRPGGSGSEYAQAWLGAGCDSSERNASALSHLVATKPGLDMGPAQRVLARGLDARQHLMPSSTKRVPIQKAHCPLDVCREHPEMAPCTVHGDLRLGRFKECRKKTKIEMNSNIIQTYRNSPSVISITSPSRSPSRHQSDDRDARRSKQHMRSHLSGPQLH